MGEHRRVVGMWGPQEGSRDGGPQEGSWDGGMRTQEGSRDGGHRRVVEKENTGG